MEGFPPARNLLTMKLPRYAVIKVTVKLLFMEDLLDRILDPITDMRKF